MPNIPPRNEPSSHLTFDIESQLSQQNANLRQRNVVPIDRAMGNVAQTLVSEAGGKVAPKGNMNLVTLKKYFSYIVGGAAMLLATGSAIGRINGIGSSSTVLLPGGKISLVLEDAIPTPKDHEITTVKSMHHAENYKDVSGKKIFHKDVSSSPQVFDVCRSYFVMNMLHNVVLMDALGIKFPEGKLFVKGEQMDFFTEEFPNFKTFRQLYQEGEKVSALLSKENRALYIAAVMLIDDLNSANIGIQNDQDLAIIDYDSTYTTRVESTFRPFGELHNQLENSKSLSDFVPTRDDFQGAYNILANLLVNNEQIEQQLNQVYQVDLGNDKFDPYQVFVESIEYKMSCLRELALDSPSDRVYIPDTGCKTEAERKNQLENAGEEIAFIAKSNMKLVNKLNNLRVELEKGKGSSIDYSQVSSEQFKTFIEDLPPGAVSASGSLFQPDDPSTYKGELRYLGQSVRQMEINLPNQRELLKERFNNVHTFLVKVFDGKPIEFLVHPEVGEREAAQTIVSEFSEAIGKFPAFIKSGVDKIYIHNEGGDAYSANGYEHSILIYKKPFDAYFGNGQSQDSLESALFYLCASAAVKIDRNNFENYKRVIKQDVQYLTDHAKKSDDPRVDLIESLPFFYANKEHPERLPEGMKTLLKNAPEREKYFNEHIFPKYSIRGMKL